MSGLTRWGFDRKAGGPKRPVPLVRAYRGPWPILSHRAMAEVMRDEAEQLQAVPPKPKKEAKPRIKSGATVKGYQAKAGDEAQGGRICEPCMEPVSRPAAGRSAAATSEFMDVTAGETAPVPNPAEAAPPKQASAPVAVMAALPLAVSTRPTPARAPIGPTGKIDIAAVPSGMEAAAQKWRAPEEQRNALPPVPGEDGKVWCAGCDARVPTWFGRDCISATCSLKGSQ